MYKFKKLISSLAVIVLVTFITHATFAQEGEKSDRLTKITDKISERLDMDEKQKAAFAPIYERYWNERIALAKEGRPDRGSKKMVDLSDSEIEQIIQRSFDYKRKRIDLSERYHNEFKRVLSMKQLAKLHLMEGRMKDKMRKKFKERGEKMRDRKQKMQHREEKMNRGE